MDPTLGHIIDQDTFDPSTLKQDPLIKGLDYLNGLKRPSITPNIKTIPTSNIDNLTPNPNYVDIMRYEELTKIKDDFDHPRFDAARRISNPFESLGNSIFMNRAAVKLANLDAIFNLTNNFGAFTNGTVEVNPDSSYPASETFNFAAIAEAPGGFIQYLQFRRPRSQGFAMSLSPASDGIRWKTDKLNMDPERLVIYGGVDESGDLYTQADNFVDYVKSNHDHSGVNLMTADGGFEIKPDQYDKQEFLSTRLILSELLIAFKLVKPGGHIVIKMFDTVGEMSFQLLMLVALSFENFSLFKPISSRPANSERYLVATNKRDNDNLISYTQMLENAWRSYTDDITVTNIFDYDVNDAWVIKFTEWLKTVNDYTINLQIFYSNKIVQYLNQIEIKYPLINLYKALTLWNIPDNPYINITNYNDNRFIPNLPGEINLQPLTDPKFSTVGQEYQRWLNYRIIWKTFRGLGTNNKTRYEIQNIIVKFMIWWINNPEEYVVARDIAIAEFKSKINYTMTSFTFDRIMSLTDFSSENRGDVVVNQESGQVNYLAFSFNIAPAWLNQMLLKYNDYDHLARTLMRYDILMPSSGNFWSISPHVIQTLRNVGVEYEAFANPMVHSLEKYYSPFPTLDRKYGSLGSFLTTKLTPGRYEVNPPYIEDILYITSQKITRALASGEPFTFFVYYPAWLDSAGYKQLKDSVYFKQQINLTNHNNFDLIHNSAIRASFINIFMWLTNESDIVFDIEDMKTDFYH